MKVKVDQTSDCSDREGYADDCSCMTTADMAKVTRKGIALVSAVCVDLSLFYAAGLVATRSVFGHFARLWLHAALRCSALSAVTLLTLGDLNPLLIRVIASHSLLPAVFETGTKALYREETECGPSADARCWLVCAAASLVGALFWEISVPDAEDAAAGKEKKQKARVLFLRVLALYKPEYLLLLGGLLMLTLAVLCEYRPTSHDENEDVIPVQDSRYHLLMSKELMFQCTSGPFKEMLRLSISLNWPKLTTMNIV